ncbi:alpha-glucoside transport system substrate-binding protein [Lentzea albidocapillata subsp. violacea]|uniref:Alpha-glucoside transport system substrate-binding protein n=1 Tax=Lentzea albidocapillata subsp. violacea TaxID=128104 RepID=A0A1G8YUT5_9PSEU|nr:extracellular solute-binding protein [Lentzea albidocapillata]SDK06507.1 alpha-glucoside transport system substrate-binding protein [Lentzea albidocapillata subsp. violacea]
MRKQWIALLALTAAACSGGAAGTGTTEDLKGQTVEVVGPWTGDEQKSFEQVLKVFTDRTGAEVRYTPAGDELPTVVQTRISGGTPPNVALIAQPGLVAQFARAGALKPVNADVEKAVTDHNAAVWKQLGSVDGKLYGFAFKTANKSAFWYSEKAFQQVGATPPATWDDLIKTSRAISETGLAPVSVGGADGWTLTDWFENVYLRTAGPDNYDKLAKHEIPWTDPTVRKALEELAKLWGDPTLIAGGALQTEFPKSVTNVFGEPSTAAMVFEADFVASIITTNTKAKVGEDARFFPFPSVAGSKDAVVAGGDMAVQFKDDKATTELMKFLASPESGKVWAGLGGFLSPNKDIPETAYPDAVTQELAKRIVDAGDNVRFDMSDLAPAAFGGTKGAGEWKDLQDFLADPKNVDGIMARLEANAAKAFGK